MYSLSITIDFGEKNKAKDFFASIKPELNDDFLRSKTRISQKNSVIAVEVTAADKTALRASLNAIVKPLVIFGQLEELQ